MNDTRVIQISLLRWRVILAFIAWVILAGAYGNYKAFDNADHIASESAKREYDSCVTGNDGRRALKDVIEIATADGVDFDLTSLPSFPTMDEETQRFITELNALLNVPSDENDDSASQRLRKFSSDNLGLRDCDLLLHNN